MARFVTDTHALVWYLTNLPNLSAAARAVFRGAAAGANQILVPAIVVAELIMMVEKRRTTLNAAHVITALESAIGFQLVPLTVPIVLRIQDAPTLPDLHDRLIVATALNFDATLITQDRAITQSGLTPILW